jgi:hypothetical protein
LGQWQHQPNANPPPPHNHIPPPLVLFNTIHHHQPLSLPHNFQPPPPQLSTTDPKSPLTCHLQLTPWPTHYRAAPLPKYHGNADPSNSPCATKLSQPQPEGTKPPSPNLSSSLLRTLHQTGTLGSCQDAFILDSNSKKNSCSTSRGSKRSSTRKKIFCPALKEKKRRAPIFTGGSCS